MHGTVVCYQEKSAALTCDTCGWGCRWQQSPRCLLWQCVHYHTRNFATLRKCSSVVWPTLDCFALTHTLPCDLEAKQATILNPVHMGSHGQHCEQPRSCHRNDQPSHASAHAYLCLELYAYLAKHSTVITTRDDCSATCHQWLLSIVAMLDIRANIVTKGGTAQMYCRVCPFSVYQQYRSHRSGQ